MEVSIEALEANWDRIQDRLTEARAYRDAMRQRVDRLRQAHALRHALRTSPLQDTAALLQASPFTRNDLPQLPTPTQWLQQWIAQPLTTDFIPAQLQAALGPAYARTPASLRQHLVELRNVVEFASLYKYASRGIPPPVQLADCRWWMLAQLQLSLIAHNTRKAPEKRWSTIPTLEQLLQPPPARPVAATPMSQATLVQKLIPFFQGTQPPADDMVQILGPELVQALQRLSQLPHINVVWQMIFHYPTVKSQAALDPSIPHGIIDAFSPGPLATSLATHLAPLGDAISPANLLRRWRTTWAQLMVQRSTIRNVLQDVTRKVMPMWSSGQEEVAQTRFGNYLQEAIHRRVCQGPTDLELTNVDTTDRKVKEAWRLVSEFLRTLHTVLLAQHPVAPIPTTPDMRHFLHSVYDYQQAKLHPLKAMVRDLRTPGVPPDQQFMFVQFPVVPILRYPSAHSTPDEKILRLLPLNLEFSDMYRNSINPSKGDLTTIVKFSLHYLPLEEEYRRMTSSRRHLMIHEEAWFDLPPTDKLRSSYARFVAESPILPAPYGW